MQVDDVGTESTHLASFMSLLIGRGFNPKPTGLRVTSENGAMAIVMCRARKDDNGRPWFFVAGGPWLAEADQPTWAVTALQSHLNGAQADG